MNATIVQGDLLNQDVDVIVNAWNRNIIMEDELGKMVSPMEVRLVVFRTRGVGKPMESLRRYGRPPFSIAVLHGGPGGPGYKARVARELSDE